MICHLIVGEEIEKDMRAIEITKYNEFNGSPYNHIKKEYFYKFTEDKEELGTVSDIDNEIDNMEEEEFELFKTEYANKIFLGIIVNRVSCDIDELTANVSDESINNAKNKYKSLRNRNGNLFLLMD